MLNKYNEWPDANLYEFQDRQVIRKTDEKRSQSRDALWAKRAQMTVASRREQELQQQAEVSWSVRCIRAWNAFWTIDCEAPPAMNYDMLETEAEELRSQRKAFVRGSLEVLKMFEYNGNETDLFEFNEMLREDYVADCSKIRSSYAAQVAGLDH